MAGTSSPGGTTTLVSSSGNQESQEEFLPFDTDLEGNGLPNNGSFSSSFYNENDLDFNMLSDPLGLYGTNLFDPAPSSHPNGEEQGEEEEIEEAKGVIPTGPSLMSSFPTYGDEMLTPTMGEPTPHQPRPRGRPKRTQNVPKEDISFEASGGMSYNYDDERQPRSQRLRDKRDVIPSESFEEWVYKEDEFVAVRCEDRDRFWICQLTQDYLADPNDEESSLRVRWLEKRFNDVYELIDTSEIVSSDTIVCPVALEPQVTSAKDKEATEDGRPRKFKLPQKERLKIIALLDREAEEETQRKWLLAQGGNISGAGFGRPGGLGVSAPGTKNPNRVRRAVVRKKGGQDEGSFDSYDSTAAVKGPGAPGAPKKKRKYQRNPKQAEEEEEEEETLANGHG